MILTYGIMNKFLQYLSHNCRITGTLTKIYSPLAAHIVAFCFWLTELQLVGTTFTPLRNVIYSKTSLFRAFQILVYGMVFYAADSGTECGV